MPIEIKVGVSARHVHLSQDTVDILFGEGYKLTKYKDLYQIHEYACNEQVTISTLHGQIEHVRVLGPTREYNQVEISKSDTRKLKVNPPVRNSGNLKDSAPVTLKGPKGMVNLSNGCIIATRHIHLSPEEAKSLDIENNDVVSVFVEGVKSGIMNNVYCKVKDGCRLEIHLDVDDANAFNLDNDDKVYLIKKLI